MCYKSQYQFYEIYFAQWSSECEEVLNTFYFSSNNNHSRDGFARDLAKGVLTTRSLDQHWIWSNANTCVAADENIQPFTFYHRYHQHNQTRPEPPHTSLDAMELFVVLDKLGARDRDESCLQIQKVAVRIMSSTIFKLKWRKKFAPSIVKGYRVQNDTYLSHYRFLRNSPIYIAN